MPEGAELRIDVTLEEVTEGVLVTADVLAPLAGECARCLDEFTSSIEVGFRELFAAGADGAEDDGYRLDGDLLDLEPALRDALVLELPLSPLCSADCAGLCARCGIRLADAEPGHRHSAEGGVWAALKDLLPAGQPASGDPDDSAAALAEGKPASPGRPEDTSIAGMTDPAGSKER